MRSAAKIESPLTKAGVDCNRRFRASIRLTQVEVIWEFVFARLAYLLDFCVTIEHCSLNGCGATLIHFSLTLCILGGSRCLSMGYVSRRSSESRL
jgi:hypothetical protein